jgi:hypothetical protein
MAITIFVKTVDRRNCSNDDMDEYPYNAVMVCVKSKFLWQNYGFIGCLSKNSHMFKVSLRYSIEHRAAAKKAWVPKGARMIRMQGRTM